MNDQHDKPPKDPKRETGEQAVLRDIQPGNPSPDRAPFMPQTEETPHHPSTTEGETVFTMEQSREIRAIVREEIETNLQVAEFRAAARRFETNADQMQRIFSADQLQRASWERTYKEQYDALKRAMDTDRATNTAAVGGLNGRIDEIQAGGQKRHELLDVLVSTISIWAGHDIKDPQARKLGSSVFEMAKEAIDRSQLTEVDQANMRKDVSAMVNQIQGWLPETKAIKEQLARHAENDRIQAEAVQKLADERAETERRKRFVLDLATKVLKSKWAMGVILSAATSVGTLGVFGEQIATFFRILLTGGG